MRKIVLVNQNAGYLTIDIANALKEKYDKVALIAGIVKPMERELNPEIKVRKIIRLNRTTVGRRLFSWFWGSLQIFTLLLFSFRGYKIIYTSNPPVAFFSSLIIRNRFSLLIYDIFPDVLNNFNIRDGSVVFKLWDRINKALFKRAERIITLSDGMAEKIASYISPEKIEVIPNWSGSEKFAPLSRDKNHFISDHKLDEKFVVLYSGNLGFTHKVEVIIEAAKLLSSFENIHFMIIGEGAKKKSLIQLSAKYCLKNCSFLTWQNREILPYSLASADLAVVTLNDETARLSVPSKTYNHMAAGSPLLCIAPDDSELAFLVKEHGNGMCFSEKNINEITGFIRDLSKNPELKKQMSVNSLKASRLYTYSNAQKYS